MDWVNMLKHYQEDLEDKYLLDEAIGTCENYFKSISKDELMHRNRTLAIAYLALKQAKKATEE